eukprot:2421219-Rhodomonas_salina.1
MEREKFALFDYGIEYALHEASLYEWDIAAAGGLHGLRDEMGGVALEKTLLRDVDFKEVLQSYRSELDAMVAASPRLRSPLTLYCGVPLLQWNVGNEEAAVASGECLLAGQHSYTLDAATAVMWAGAGGHVYKILFGVGTCVLFLGAIQNGDSGLLPEFECLVFPVRVETALEPFVVDHWGVGSVIVHEFNAVPNSTPSRDY